MGAGFLPPATVSTQDQAPGEVVYAGYLPLRTLNEYSDRLEDIKDALESLNVEDLKDHVLTAHASTKPPPAVSKVISGVRGSYGRMRDFTALVTATVIQALPDLAIVHRLIDTWDVRVASLRELPIVLDLMGSSKSTLQKAMMSCRNPELARVITLTDFYRIRDALGDQIKDLGKRIDGMLDLLEGQEDSLPQSWIDLLETLELDFATWKAEAEQIAYDNLNRDPPPAEDKTTTSEMQKSLDSNVSDGQMPQPQFPSGLHIPTHGHRRDRSEVSIADSVLSTISGAEIVDARKSQVLLSPKIQLVDNAEPLRPPVLHRASTASIEVVSKDQLRKLDVRRSMSTELLTKMASHQGDTTPTKAYRQLNAESPERRTPLTESEDPFKQLHAPVRDDSVPSFPSPSLMVQPLKVQTKTADEPAIPALPRRSSKRSSFSSQLALSVSNDMVSPVSAVQPPSPPKQVSPVSPSKPGSEPTLDSKIQDILENLPTRIRLGDGPDESADRFSNSIRSSTPTPALIPETKTARKSSAAEPDIRVYHLHQNGRDAKPIKLFVRAVGENGERVMVRVGGGWADLGEYLREYSSHHGSRSASEGVLEVAQYPVKTDRDRKTTSQVLSPTQPKATTAAIKKMRRRSLSNSSSGSRSRSPSPPPVPDSTSTPPVPAIPAGYTMYSPTMSVSTKPNGLTETTFEDGDPTTKLKAEGQSPVEPEAGPYSRTSALHVPSVSTVTTVASPAAINPSKYTPLGGAGPKSANRRSATYGAIPKEANNAWVEGMVGKARAVSNNTIHGPTTTTTTTVTSSAPVSRRTSGMVSSSPKEQKVAGQQSLGDVTSGGRRKSRLGLGDVSGIKRVFLRRKSSVK